MSENTINTQIDGTTIQASHVNQFKTALVEDVLPRNLSGQNEDEAGSLGSDIYRWLKGIISTVFTNKLSIGAAGDEATNPSITNSTDTMDFNVITGERYTFRVNNTLTAVIDNNGFDGAYLKDGSVTTNRIGDDAVTTIKLANSSVTESKIAEDAVTTQKIAVESVTPSRISHRTATDANIDDEDNLFFQESAIETVAASATETGVGVTITVASPSVVCWSTGTTNSALICGVQTDGGATQEGAGGLFIVNSNISITVTMRNTQASEQTGTVTLKVYVLK